MARAEGVDHLWLGLGDGNVVDIVVTDVFVAYHAIGIDIGDMREARDFVINAVWSAVVDFRNNLFDVFTLGSIVCVEGLEGASACHRNRNERTIDG